MTHSFIQHVLDTYYVPGIIFDTKDSKIKPNIVCISVSVWVYVAGGGYRYKIIEGLAP